MKLIKSIEDYQKEYQNSIDYVHVYISHLRRKLEADPRNPKYLLTERGIGYRFERRKPK